MVADALPIYPLYALLFSDHGLSDGKISALFAIWSAVSALAEVPTGALADRFSRGGSLVAAGILQAAGYALWILFPGFGGFAAGFALWGVSGAFVSGALQALLYDSLTHVGAQSQYARVLGRVSAAGLVGQIPAAASASVLFSAGGYALVTWVSVTLCLAAALLASRLPEPSRESRAGSEPGYLAEVRAGISAAAQSHVRLAVVVVALVNSLDTIDEYFPLLARDWGVPTYLNPLALLGIPLVGAAGAMLGAGGSRLRPWPLACLLGTAALLLGLAGIVRHPAGLTAVALFYGAYRLVLVVADTRLQDRIETSSRATVASIASLGTEVAVFAFYAAWTWGGVTLIAALVGGVAATLPRLLRRTASEHELDSGDLDEIG